MGGFAWVTLATNDSYSLGALVLAHSLKAVGTAQQLAVLVTPGVTKSMRDKLAAVFNLVQEVNILDSRDEANLRLLKRPELGITFTKLHCWRLTQFEKCVFLDADTLVLQHCDELFEREELSAAPDVGWPDCFNSGVFVYKPSLETYDKLIQFALEKGSFDGGDQGLLNLYFSDWAHKDISRHLPFIYNMCSTACYSYLPAFKQFGANAKIIHFIGAQKPWLQYFNTESRRVQPSADSSHLQEVLQRWWDIFCSLIHPHLSPAMPQGQLQHAVFPSYFPPQYAPPPNPTSSADDYENAWDPWDEYDQKIAQSTHYTSVSTHYIQNQPIESLNTNASHVADQPTIHNQPQSHNFNTYSTQNNSFNQPISQPAYQHVPRVPTPPPSPQPQFHHHVTQYHHQEPSYNQPESQYHHPEPQYHQPETQYHQPEPQYYQPEPQYHQPETQHHLEPQSYHHESQNEQSHHAETDHQHTHNHHHEYHQEYSHQNPSSQHHQPHSEHSQYNDSHQYTNHPPEQPVQQNEHLHSYPSKSDTFPPDPDRPKSPNRPDPVPILPKECEATTTVSNDMSLSSTIEDCSKQDNAGLAGALAQLTLGVPRTPEQDALENVLRKQAWEVGNIDYLGRDSFENIWSKITETLDASVSKLSVSASELEPAAPAQSQSETAPTQQEAIAVLSDTPVATPTGTESSIPVATPTDQQQTPAATSESVPSAKSTETPGKPEAQVTDTSTVVSSTALEEVKKGDSSQPLSEVAPTPQEKGPVDEPAVCPLPEKIVIKEAETKASEPQIDVPKSKLPELQKDVLAEGAKAPEPETAVPATEATESQTAASTTEIKATEPQKDVPATETKASDPETAVSVTETTAAEPQVTAPATETETPQVQAATPATETKVTEPQTAAPATEIKTTEAVTAIPATETKVLEPQTEAQVCPIPQKKETEAKAAQPDQPAAVCPLPEKKEPPKKTEAQLIAPQPEKKNSEAPSTQSDASKEVPQEAPKVTPQVEESTKEPETLPQPAVPQQPQALPEEKPEVSPSVAAPKGDSKPKTKKVHVAGESAASKDTTKAAPSKASPKTEVTEATPPATPGSPLVEKTKESLAAEASIPDTPPPTEGGSTPTPPPRKTDKPKKVAAKSKK